MRNRALDAIERLVFKGTHPIVVALTGGWGEGKSYFWKEVVIKDQIEPKSAYVTVFGADTLLAIRERVGLACLEARGADVIRPSGGWGGIVRIKDRFFGSILGGSRHILGVLNKKWGLPESLAVELLHSFLKPATVLCIDDLERLSKKVDQEDLLGYICELRDKWNLRIVLIFNRETLDKDKDSAFHRYQEKVIDREIPFSLKPDEIVELVFNDLKVTFSGVDVFIKERCVILGLKNIRILAKAKSYFQEIAAIPEGPVDPEFLKTALNSILLFSWVRFSHQNPAGLDFNRLSGYSSLFEEFNEAGKSADGRREQKASDPAKALLEKYGYGQTDDLDLALIRFIQTDVLDVDELRKLYVAHQSLRDSRAKRDAFSDVISKFYHGTLKNNPVELSTALESALGDYLEDIDPANLGFALEIFRVCGRDDLAEQFFTKFKETRGHQFTTQSVRDLPIGFTPSTYAPLRQYFRNLVDTGHQDDRSMETVMSQIAEVGGATAGDCNRLMSFSQQEMRDYFTTHNKPRLTSLMLTLVRSGTDPLRQRVFSVATEIAAASPISKLRLEGMGVLPEPAQAPGEVDGDG